MQLRLEGAALSPAADRQVRKAILKNLRETLAVREIPFETGCDHVPGYVLLNFYARFLDPKT